MANGCDSQVWPVGTKKKEGSRNQCNNCLCVGECLEESDWEGVGGGLYVCVFGEGGLLTIMAINKYKLQTKKGN